MQPRQTRLKVQIQEADFDPAQLQRELVDEDGRGGAVATFTGYVRGQDSRGSINGMLLEHYPGMTEHAIGEIMAEAGERWSLLGVSVLHRVGRLRPGDKIVWVGSSAVHRAAAFESCEFIMDYLKTRAPFWKKEYGPTGDNWVSARASDLTRAQRWE